MKGKIILTFALALLALTVIGFVGQNTLTQLIVSIKKESQPNPKLISLKEILSDLSDAENSVRTYTITRESENLTPFYQSISTIDNKINSLYELTKNKDQLKMVDSLQVLIEKKYSILKQLIDIKKDQGVEEVLERVLENIAKIREKSSTPQPITKTEGFNPDENYDRIKKVKIPEPRQQEKKVSIFQRIFGGGNESHPEETTDQPTELLAEETPKAGNTSDTVTQSSKYRLYTFQDSPNDLNSSDIGQIISKIGQERNENIKAIKEQELALTQRDNDLMKEIREVANRIEDREKTISVNRAEAAQKATDKAIYIMSLTWIIALIIFAILLFIIISDISRNQKNKDKLKEAKERAEKLARVKEEFLSNMSHEIRTPLNSIIGYTEQLEYTALNPNQQKYLKNIHHSGDHLLTIINDILDYAKLESGNLSLEEIGFSVEQQLIDVVDTFQNQIKKKNLQFHYNIEDDVSEILVGDPVRFRQILINLISNAIKFTPAGQVTVNISQQALEHEKVKLKLIVSDTGIGIPKSKLNSIFKNFAQADSGTTRKYGGTGLGLSIVKKITSLHNGTISVESEENTGTSFTVELIYKTGKKEDLKEAKKKSSIYHIPLEGKKILVVDDQEYNLELIKVIFDKWKIDSTLISSGEQAIANVKENHYDMIFMDVQMPEISGLEVTKQIRKYEKQHERHTPIIALTAAASKEEAESCIKHGMNGYLLKPFTQKNLFLKIAETLGISTEEESRSTEDATEPSDSMNLDDLHELSNGNPAFVVNMLNIFVKNFDIDLNDLKGALKNKDWNKLQRKSHKMIPPCRHLGFNTLMTSLKEIEAESEHEQDFYKIDKLVKNISKNYRKIRPVIEAEVSNIQKDISESAA
ncbi:response regulator [Fulvivirga sp. 29W222]|uniref:histidine kinase n=1 Tax=Fulvivirga marina TaxID=2494733 RepID=A0A937FWF5_9BACT|nr:ATP-binding protein [Fulvivirga marina]MBL6447299.1 response regulator [Fulvivirga marina]